MKIVKKTIPVIFAITLCALLIFDAKSCSAAVMRGINICTTTLIPSIFPFMFLAQFVLKSGISKGFTRLVGMPLSKMLHLPKCASSALMLGAIGGYPVGARCVGELYDKRMINRCDAENLLLCCNNCGPAFFIGAIGASVFSSVKLGLMLWLCHLTAALLTGMLQIKKKQLRSEETYESAADLPLADAFCSSCWDAVISMVKICAYVILFNVFMLLINSVQELLHLPDDYISLINGTFELTSGIMSLDGRITASQVCLAAFITGWGGLCVHLQTISLLNGKGLRLKRYFTAKLVQGILSSAISYVLLMIAPDTAVNTFTAVTKSGPLEITAHSSVMFTLPWLLLLLLIFVCCAPVKNMMTNSNHRSGSRFFNVKRK